MGGWEVGGGFGWVGWTRRRSRLIKKERLSTFNSELGGRAVLAMLVGGGAAVHTLVRHANTLDDQGQQPLHLRAPDPLRVRQTLAVMIPFHPGEGQPVE